MYIPLRFCPGQTPLEDMWHFPFPQFLSAVSGDLINFEIQGHLDP